MSSLGGDEKWRVVEGMFCLLSECPLMTQSGHFQLQQNWMRLTRGIVGIFIGGLAPVIRAGPAVFDNASAELRGF